MPAALVPALPFGLACAFLCLRRLLVAIAAPAIYCLVWAAAFYSAVYLCGRDVSSYLAMLPARFTGGLAVAALTSIETRRLRRLAALAALPACSGEFSPCRLVFMPGRS